MDILFVIGLPRSGTSLVYNLVHKEANRDAITYKDLGITVPDKYHEYLKCRELAEIHDLNLSIPETRKWLERRGERWVVKSVELNALPQYLETFPDTRFLWCVRPAAETMGSVREYFSVTGLRWPYSPTDAVRQAVSLAKTFPEKFDWIDVKSYPLWDSDTEPTKTLTSMEIQSNLDILKGVARRVEFGEFKERY